MPRAGRPCPFLRGVAFILPSGLARIHELEAGESCEVLIRPGRRRHVAWPSPAMSPIQHFLSQIRGVGNYSVMSPTGATTSATVAEPTDAELLAAFADRRDERAFVILVARYSGLVRGTAQRRIGDAHLAEDVAQVAFSLLARRAAALRNVRCLGAWLHRVTVLQSARELRSMARERRKLHKAMNQARIEEDGCDPWQETWPFIDEALDALPPSDRELLVLRYYERLGFAEVFIEARPQRGGPSPAGRARARKAFQPAATP